MDSLKFSRGLADKKPAFTAKLAEVAKDLESPQSAATAQGRIHYLPQHDCRAQGLTVLQERQNLDRGRGQRRVLHLGYRRQLRCGNLA
jgi:hypothetical protein